MSVSNRHIVTQAPVLGALGRSAVQALKQRVLGGPTTAPATPGPTLSNTAPPLPPQLLRDYIVNVGGDPSAYRGQVPHHLFPQWGFPLATRTLEGVPYPLLSVMNYGCHMRINGPLPAGVPLRATAQLESIDEDERRAILQQHVVTGPEEQPDALVADFFVFVPLRSRTKKATGAPTSPRPKPRAKPRVPETAKEIARWKLSANAGLEFAKLTGDFNPVHWVPGYAKASGFRNVILHGFGTMARAFEGLNRGLFSGRTNAITEFDVRFTRPLVLPARVGLYVEGERVFVGDAPGGPAYLVGTFKTGTNNV